MDNPAENKTLATSQTAAEHGAGITARRHEQAAQPVEDPFRQGSGSQDSGSQGTTGRQGDQGGTVTGSPGPGHNPGVDTGRLSSTGHGNGGQDQERDSRSDRGGVSAGPDEQAGEQHEQASASAAAGSYAGQSTGQAGAGLDGGSAGDRNTDVGGDAATVDGQPVLGSTFVADQEQGVTEPGAGQGGEELNEAEPGPGGVVPGAGLEGISGQPGAGTGTIGDVEPVPADDAGNGGLRGSFGPTVTGADASAGDSGKQGSESEEGRGASGKPGAESLSQEQQGGENGKAADTKGVEEHTPKDQAIMQNPVPEAEVVQQGDTSSEASPDQNAEDPRWAAVMSAIEDLQAQNQNLEKRQAESDAKLDAMQAKVVESEARADKLEAQHEEDQAKIGELENKLAVREQQRGDAPEGDEEPVPSGEPDVIKNDEHVDPGQDGKSRWQDAELSDQHRDREADKPEGDRPGLFSNAKVALYSAAAAGGFGAGTAEYLHSVTPVEATVITAVLGVVGAAIPVWRERNRKHGD